MRTNKLVAPEFDVTPSCIAQSTNASSFMAVDCFICFITHAELQEGEKNPKNTPTFAQKICESGTDLKVCKTKNTDTFCLRLYVPT